LLVLAMLVLHANALGAFFVGDDFEILARTVELDGLGDALRMTFVGNWGPMSYVQFYLDWLVGGLDPLAYHLTNLFWHALLLVGLYGFLRTVWPEQRLAAWAAALLFLTHPANDQGVSYISARSHSIAAALAVATLALYARSRLVHGNPPRRRAALLGTALATAFLAGLSKESALMLPVWIAACEWLFASADRPAVLRLARSAGSALLFAGPAAAVFATRHLLIGGAPPKLGAASGSAARALGQLALDLPVYALVGGLPFPCAWIDLPDLQRLAPLGWLLIGAALALGLACLVVRTTRDGARTGAALWLLGLTIAAVTLLPVIYAELEIQRRYLYMADVGIVLMAVGGSGTLATRLPRTTRIVLAVLVLAGAVGTIQRNALQRRAGEVARRLVETVLDAPLDEAPGKASPGQSVVLVQLPRYYGGDRVSGAVLLQRTDLVGALVLYGIPRPDVNYALKCYHAQDHAARLQFTDELAAELEISFRSPRAWRAALARDLEADPSGDALSAELLSADPTTRVVRYRLHFNRYFWQEHGELLLYSDGGFSRLSR
jgi:hypothetical protein